MFFCRIFRATFIQLLNLDLKEFFESDQGIPCEQSHLLFKAFHSLFRIISNQLK